MSCRVWAIIGIGRPAVGLRGARGGDLPGFFALIRDPDERAAWYRGGWGLRFPACRAAVAGVAPLSPFYRGGF